MTQAYFWIGAPILFLFIALLLGHLNRNNLNSKFASKEARAIAAFHRRHLKP